MAKATRPIPEGYRAITPHLCVKGAAQAIEFYKKAFGAEEIYRMPGPDGRIMHAEIRIADSIVMMAEEMPEMGGTLKSPGTLRGTSANLHIYTADCDAAFDRAVKAGATVTMPLMDMFWGDRYGMVTDPYGHVWSIATHREDVSPKEMEDRMKQMPPPGSQKP
jgi:uncharacterized glyoxalase superfamily protein PhnB